MELIHPFELLSRGDLPLAGGKGANLGAMVQAGLPVPAGFVVLTHAYRAFVAQAGIQAEIERLAAAADPDSQASLDATSAQIRTLFDRNPVPQNIAEAITEAYTKLGGGAVAVRSSATAEDLPDASFAGQQETYLNIHGADQVVAASGAAGLPCGQAAPWPIGFAMASRRMMWPWPPWSSASSRRMWRACSSRPIRSAATGAAW
jgi:pyruvate,water dikinase